MKFNDLPKYFIINFSINNDSGNLSSDRLSGIDIGGLRRDFITSLTTELFESTNGIFMTREGTKKYFLNPNFKHDEYYEYIINKITNNQYDYKRFTDDFYEFIGKLITFILVNDCGLDKNISSYLTASLSKTIDRNEEPNFDDADYLYFMFEDFPEYTSSILNLMKMNPDEIEYTSIQFNDYYNLVEVDEDVTKDSISKFLYKTAKYMMTKTILRKGIDNINDSDYLEVVKNGEKINKLFIKGIKGDINNYLREKDLPLKVVNSYLVKPTMSSEIISKLISNFKNTMSKKKDNATSNKKKLGRMTDLFIKYVLKNKKQLDELEYHKFMDKLLKFWSGSSFYKEDENYKIEINNMLSDQHLPQSHTCFFLIDLPLYTGTNDEEIGEKLYNKIDIAIANVEEGIGLQGGGKLKKSKSKKK
jgi:transcription termination factor NusB